MPWYGPIEEYEYKHDFKRYEKEYEKCYEFILHSSEIVAEDITELLHPYFVNIYLYLLAGKELRLARKFSDMCPRKVFKYVTGYEDVMMELFSFATIREAWLHPYFRNFCVSRYQLEIPIDSFERLEKHLVDSRSMVLYFITYYKCVIKKTPVPPRDCIIVPRLYNNLLSPSMFSKDVFIPTMLRPEMTGAVEEFKQKIYYSLTTGEPVRRKSYKRFKCISKEETSQLREEPGTSTQGITYQMSAQPGTSSQGMTGHMNEQPGTSDMNEQPGTSDMNEQSGTSDMNEQPGTSSQGMTSDMNEQPGTSSQGMPSHMNERPGTSSEGIASQMAGRLETSSPEIEEIEHPKPCVKSSVNPGNFGIPEPVNEIDMYHCSIHYGPFQIQAAAMNEQNTHFACGYENDIEIFELDLEKQKSGKYTGCTARLRLEETNVPNLVQYITQTHLAPNRYNPDGTARVYNSSHKNIFGVPDYTNTATYNHSDSINDIAVSFCEFYFATAASDRTACLWNFNRPEPVETYVHPSEVTVSVIKELVNTRYTNCKDMSDYLHRAISAYQQLNSTGIKPDEKLIARIILANLPDRFEPLVMELKNCGEEITVDNVRNKLLTEDVKPQVEANGEQAFVNEKCETYFKGKLFKCHLYGHKSSDRSKVTYNERESEKRNGFKTKQPKRVEAYMVDVCVGSSNPDPNVWFMDICASYHMTPHKELIDDYIKPSVKLIKTGSSMIEVEGVGKVAFLLSRNGEKVHVTFSNVLHVPKLTANLLSIKYLNKTFGMISTFTRERCLVYKNKHLVARGTGVGNNLYSLDGKIHKQLFSKGKAKRAKEILGIVHADVCGPMNVASIGGSQYFVSFIDDLSRMTFVYFLKHKSKVFEKFRIFQSHVEKQTGRSIKVLQSDNGTKYINNEMMKYLESKGIQHQTSIPFTPEQMEVAERNNRTVVERARSMLADAHLDRKYWAEASQTANHCKNVSPTVSVAGMTPYEKWSGDKPNLEYLRVFGCRAFVHISKENRTKWDAKNQKQLKRLLEWPPMENWENSKTETYWRFEMKDLGTANYCLGIKIERDRKNGSISLNQTQYLESMLRKYCIHESHPVPAPLDSNSSLNKFTNSKEDLRKIPIQAAVGNLLYAAQATRPDIRFAVNLLCQFCNSPDKTHWTAIKHIMRYLRGTTGTTLSYTKDHGDYVIGYCDSNYGGDIADRKSTSGYVFMIGDEAVSWSSKRQHTVATSTTEAEYMALSAAAQEAM
ncbi:Retrovirus-related Pol polyprotein like [Argiope bruennichi]|uniref:Retrovirus-related Pol polyprotein like n=1 Tax=Argiope bruennichi TaxID=94029 RepID=A0A8T0F0H5_ARGBR|nr:Retrovirus-related Pol polyprotein like [Argiope bruennichi]